VRQAFAEALRCPACREGLALESRSEDDGRIREGVLRCRCGQAFPVIAGVPRILPQRLASTLAVDHSDFFGRHADLGSAGEGPPSASLRTLRAFGDEWQRFPELLAVHGRIFDWYFEGPEEIPWKGLRVLDAGCGMGRWLHFARSLGADVVGLDFSRAIDVAAGREGDGADFVQADLRWPPFPDASFDLVYCLGVVHHLEDPLAGVRSLAGLVRPGGELRLYVYRSLEDESFPRRALQGLVGFLRGLTTRVPYVAVHAIAWLIAVLATGAFLVPRRLLRRWGWGDRLTAGLPLTHYADVPFRMLVAEQFDRLCAPIEGRYTREGVAGWLEGVGFEVVAILPGLGWRAIGRRPRDPQGRSS
jgi:SAM-dependent methyltransferase/uncharacterized protein YbaR (Trm112 family)